MHRVRFDMHVFNHTKSNHTCGLIHGILQEAIHSTKKQCNLVTVFSFWGPCFQYVSPDGVPPHYFYLHPNQKYPQKIHQIDVSLLPAIGYELMMCFVGRAFTRSPILSKGQGEDFNLYESVAVTVKGEKAENAEWFLVKFVFCFW